MKGAAAIKKSLQQVFPFSEKQIDLFLGKLTILEIKKKRLLIQPGEICRSLYFINAGSMRCYSLLGQQEITIQFFIEEHWISDMESLLNQQPSSIYIEAVEDCQLASISLGDLHDLMKADPVFHMLNTLIGQITIPMARLASLTTKSPDEKYKELLLDHPEWINRFPQMQIASYLGVTPETLSRVRSRLK